MASPSTAVATEAEGVPRESVPPVDANLPRNNEYRSEHEDDEEKDERNEDGDRDGGRGKNEDEEEDENEDEDEDEEEDLDFNPFLKDTPSREASSSLSSEIEGPDADIIDSGANTSVALVKRSRVKPSGYPVGGTEHEEEIVTQATPSSDGACSTGVENFSPSRIEEGRAVSTSQPENGALGEKNPVVEMDDEGAICKRTRARYSLASFTLDELETFLQETDDEDDIQNVDDQEEYRKFLAAVLLGGDVDSQNQQGNENVDEDDDNDADFELEIEEALESDLDENTKDKIQKQEYEAVGRRHKTRRNRGQKSSIEHNKKLVALSSRPLRPLVPYIPMGHFSAFDGRSLMSKQVPQCPTPVNDGLINGFTPHQIGQLYCLIHEHVQLLIQVFSISALDPARKHIASEVQKMMMEMVRIRDQVLAWRKLPHPSFCFFPPYVHPTVSDEHLKTLPSQLPSTFEAQRDCSSVGNITPPSENNIVPPNGLEGTSWVPYISSPILSVLDVAPLGLAGKYVDDVAAAVRERQRIEVGDAIDTRFEREPLFPLSNRLPSPSNDHMPKKTMAAALVEKVKKQSVAPVPKEISKLALRFYPLFNPALFPHKPPPAAVANRVLFTDSEDELLAMGLMEYNTDWKAIQQRFLPCKSKHQIFVRQKNRSSSKAPENPIKAVRRMKNSPLTLQEIARIEEGLKIFKLDWISVWKYMVPYRDPSLLPRQWRIATGTQKSYKSDETKKAKRRLYDARRRMCKTAALAGWHTSSEKEDHSTDNAGEGNNSGDNNTDREDEAYVHEAFLADWRPGTSSTPHPVSDLGGETNSIHALRHEGSRVSVQMNLSGSGGAQSPAALRSSQPYLRPYRARRANNAYLVKLAPDLPPVNLPPSVRIMSQTAFKNYQAGAAPTTLGADSRIGVPAAESEVLKAASAAKPGVNDPKKAGRTSNMAKTCTSNQYPQNSGVSKDKTVIEERDESGLQMHPLLFQTPEAGDLPYYPLNCNTSGSTSFSFFSGSQPQLNLSLFHNFHRASHTVNLLDKSLKPNETISSSGIHFHPFLQRNNGVNCESMNTHSAAQLCANPESSRGRHSQIQNPFDAALTKSCISTSPSPVSAKPSSPYERSNELDLDIHLSFTSRKQKAVGSRDVTQHRMAMSAASAPDSRLLESQNTETLSDQHKLHKMTACTPDGIGDKLDSGAHALVLFSNGENRSDIDITGDQSLPGIVMEQEELSDSEEEIGENVEFECEEMADSEGEEASNCEQNLNLQTEVENTSVDTGLDDEHCERSTRGDIDGHSCSLVEGHAVDLRSMDKGIDGAHNSTCLNLNSCPASPLVKRKYAAIRHSSGSGGETPSNKITRSTKPITPHATGQTHVNDMLEQSHNSSRKSRKRTCRSEGSSVSKGRSRKRDSSLIAYTDEQSSIHVNKDEHG